MIVEVQKDIHPGHCPSFHSARARVAIGIESGEGEAKPVLSHTGCMNS